MLAAGLHFNDEDLRANRAGCLTARQRNRVYTRRRMLIQTLLLVTIIVGAISARIIAEVLLGPPVTSAVMILLALGGEVVTVALAYGVWSLRQRYNTYLEPGYVQRAEGPATLFQLRERQNEKTRTAYFLRVDDLEFEIPDTALNAFTDGAPYIVYYSPHRQMLLSAEEVELLPRT